MGLLVILQKPLGKRLELQFLKQSHQRGQVGFLGFEFSFVKLDGHIQVDGSQHLRHQTLLGEVDDVFFLLAFQFVGVGNQVFHATVLPDQSCGGLFPDAWNARNVVGGIAPKTQNVNQLLGFLDAIAFADLFRPPHLRRFTEFGRFVKQNLVRNELPEVLVRGHHISCKTLLFSLFR